MSHERSGIYACRLGTLLLRQVSAIRITNGNTKTEVVPGGNLDRGAVVTAFADPVVRIDTDDLLGALGGSPAVSISVGLACPTTDTASLFQYQKRVDGSTFVAAGTAQHHSYSALKGFALVDEISVEQDQPAQLKLMYYPLATGSTGSVAPLSFLNAQTLVSTPNTAEIYYLGPCKYNNGGDVTLSGCLGWTLKNGMGYSTSRAGGDVWARVGAINARRPEITLRFKTLDHLYANFSGSENGKSIAAAVGRLDLYLRRGVHGGTRWSDGSAGKHMLLSISAGDLTNDDVSVREIEDAVAELTIRPTQVLSLNTATTVPADT